MHTARLPIAFLLILFFVAELTAQEKLNIEWRKVNVDCRRERRKSRKRYDLPDDRGKVTESSEHIEITTTIRTRLDDNLTDLQFDIRIIGETAAQDRDDRRPEVVATAVQKIEKIVPYERLRFTSIKTTLTEKEEKLDLDHGKETRLSGHTYLGYVGLLKDAEGNLLMVKAENAKIKRLAEDLQIIPKDIELTREGVVQPKDDD